MSTQIYDAIVLGVGGVGSSVLSNLARRDLRVLGLDRFPPGHSQGSSHGQTRLIRQAYWELPSYVPLLKRAYTLWEELSERCGQKLYHEVGVLQVGSRSGQVLPGTLASAKLHGLEVEEIAATDLADRFPGFQCLDSMAAVFERRAGYLRVEDCVQAYAAEAQQAGAELRIGEAVQEWSSRAGQIEVRTDRNTYTAKHLVITAGSWASQFLADLGIPLIVTRKPLYWFATSDLRYQADHQAPGFIYETPLGNFYGFPAIDHFGLKVAEHSGGAVVPDPLLVERAEDPVETSRVTDFLHAFLPGVSPQQTQFEVCLYTLSPDRNFLIDRHPEHHNVAFAAGLSGHGFKFASVLGEILSDLVLTGKTAVPVDFLSCDRFSTRSHAPHGIGPA
jgi:sarcosine oxidase